MSKKLNATFFTLIPKGPNLVEMREFRPINVVGSAYKLRAKILANRSMTVFTSIIGPTQGAFVQGRQILDAVVIANELIDSRVKSKNSRVIFKIDIEKAYDHVE